jgi:hypothetical protein
MGVIDRTITIPGRPEIELRLYCDYGLGNYDKCDMALVDISEGSTVVAFGKGFSRPEVGPWTWLDAPRREVVGVFIGFLDHAIESSEDDAREAWTINDEIVHNYTEDLWHYGICDDEYPACETCGDPIDYCQGHGVIA